MKSKKITIDIAVTFGSDHQEDFATNTLAMMLNSWQIYVSSRHKKNKVVYIIDFDNQIKWKKMV